MDNRCKATLDRSKTFLVFYRVEQRKQNSVWRHGLYICKLLKVGVWLGFFLRPLPLL